MYNNNNITYTLKIMTGGRLTENQLIEIVFFQLIKTFNNELKHI